MADVPKISDEALMQFGIRPHDEGAHRFDPEDELWNESLFYDWYTEDGSLAGHCRIGVLPTQKRIWFWLYVFDGTQWVGVDEARLPLDGLDWDSDTWTYAQPGLSFTREVGDPLRHNRLTVKTFGRLLSGPRTGRVVPVEVDITALGIGPCHSVGDTGVEGHTSDTLSAARFEQPTLVRGSMYVDGVEHSIDGRGERDHSWGPRMWNMQWHFLVLNGPSLRMQAARICFDPDEPDDAMTVGYHSVGDAPEDTRHVDEVRFDLEYRDDDMLDPFSGRVALDVEEAHGQPAVTITGRIDSISGAEIDASHVFSPPQPSIYRRAVIRFTPDDETLPACLGWLEINRFPNGCIFDDE